MRILVVEDDIVLGDAIVALLMRSNYAVDWFRNGKDGFLSAQNQVYDLILLDLGLPHLNGFEFIRRLRSTNITIPVIILTANQASEDVVEALDLGADDYLIKPFRLPELEARIRAQLRRSHAKISSIINFGLLELDTKARLVTANNTKLNLSPREFALLETLVMKSGKVVTKELLIESLCNWNEDIGENAIEVYVHRLRKKISPYHIHIVNVRGLGYVMEVQPHV